VYYLTDGQHNVTALADANSTVLERYVYDTYGSVLTRGQDSYKCSLKLGH
jgi:hypothetical protein